MIFYINSVNFATATTAYTDSLLTIVAPDGYYSDGSSYRQQINGVFTDIISCPTIILTGSISISNFSNNPSVTIQEVYVNSILINSNPITAGATLVGPYTVIAGNAQTIQIFTNNATDSPVTLTISTIPAQPQCLQTTGDIVFTGLDLSTGPSINLDLGGEGEMCS